MKDFKYVDFEDGYGKLADLSFSDLYVWNEDKQEYEYDEFILDYAEKMYDNCWDIIFANFCRKLIDYDKNINCDVLIQNKFVIVTVYSNYGRGQFPMQFNFRFKKHGDISIHLS